MTNTDALYQIEVSLDLIVDALGLPATSKAAGWLPSKHPATIVLLLEDETINVHRSEPGDVPMMRGTFHRLTDDVPSQWLRVELEQVGAV